MRSFALPLATPLATAHGTISERVGRIVALTDADGFVGFGEATPLPGFGTESLGDCTRALDAALAALVDRGLRSFEQALAEARRFGRRAPCAFSALDAALHDLEARRAGVPLAEWIHRRAGTPAPFASTVRVQVLLTGDTPAAVEASARAALARGFETFKLKIAAGAAFDTSDDGSRADLGLDLDRVAALRETVGPARRIRLDANEAWTTARAHAAMKALQPFEIDYVEQPVARDDLAGLRELDVHGAIPVAADEALLGAGLEGCLEMRAASILVVKPAALGGLAAAMDVFRRARDAGLRIVWSSLIDGALARAAALALAAGLGPSDEVHGLGTAGLLARDLVPAPMDSAGTIEVSPHPGLGLVYPPGWPDAARVGGEQAGECLAIVRIVEASR
jgi:o-succinylbenzoate synthase